LRSIIRNRNQSVLYCDHVHAEGEKLFELVEHATWLKIRNLGYSQWAGRQQLFEKERKTELGWHVWEECARASVIADRS
jgi:hypothetical protein